MSEFLKGFFFIFYGLRVIVTSKRLLGLSLAPFFVSFVLFLFLALKLMPQVDDTITYMMNTWIMTDQNAWYYFLYYPLWLIAWCALFLLLIYLCYLAILLIAGPFLTLMAEQVLKKAGALNASEPFNLKHWLKISLFGLRTVAIKLVIWLALAFVIMIMAFIPVLNIFTTLLIVLFLAMDATDYGYDCLQYGIKDRYGKVIDRWPRYLGMCSCLLLTMVIPGLTLLLLPASVAGASLAVADLHKESRS